MRLKNQPQKKISFTWFRNDFISTMSWSEFQRFSFEIYLPVIHEHGKAIQVNINIELDFWGRYFSISNWKATSFFSIHIFIISFGIFFRLRKSFFFFFHEVQRHKTFITRNSFILVFYWHCTNYLHISFRMVSIKGKIFRIVFLLLVKFVIFWFPYTNLCSRALIFQL